MLERGVIKSINGILANYSRLQLVFSARELSVLAHDRAADSLPVWLHSDSYSLTRLSQSLFPV